MSRSVYMVVLVSGAFACAPEEPVGGPPAPAATELWMLEERGPPVVRALRVATGEERLEVEVASMGFAYELDVEPATGRVALAYTPPPRDGEAVFDRSAIVVRSGDGEMERVACEDAGGVWCSYPAWSSGAIWYARSGEGIHEDSVIERVDMGAGEVTARIAWATEPAASSDGRALAWIALEPETGARRLVYRGEDGAVERVLVGEGVHEDIGQPFFSADGEHVYYVALRPIWSYVDAALSVFVGEAHAHSSHDVPGDWWRVSVEGGEPEQITDLGTIHYDGRADPGGEWIWAATREGVLRVHAATGEVVLERSTRVVRALEVR